MCRNCGGERSAGRRRQKSGICNQADRTASERCARTDQARKPSIAVILLPAQALAFAAPHYALSPRRARAGMSINACNGAWRLGRVRHVLAHPDGGSGCGSPDGPVRRISIPMTSDEQANALALAWIRRCYVPTPNFPPANTGVKPTDVCKTCQCWLNMHAFNDDRFF